MADSPDADADTINPESPADHDIPLNKWVDTMKEAAEIVSLPSSEREPFKNIYAGIQMVEAVSNEMTGHGWPEGDVKNVSLWRLTLVHVHSSLAKWFESCEELSKAEENHRKCISLIETALSQPAEDEHHLEVRIRCEFLLVYSLTRYAILCSERQDQEIALGHLQRAERTYHNIKDKDSQPPGNPESILTKLDSLNSKCSRELFTYVLFYLGQAYKITGQKEKAILYLHMVLRKQLEEGDYSPLTWATDTANMAGVVTVITDAFETSRNMLVDATAVLKSCSAEEKDSESYKEAWGDLGRSWVKLGVDLLDASCDRLRDISEQTRKPKKFCDVLKFLDYEKLSLEIDAQEDEFDTLVLLRSLRFPSLDVGEVQEVEMTGRYTRDYEEAKAVFLCIQKWTSAAKAYYIIDEHASDYIDIMTDYSTSFKHLAFFEPNLERQIKMHRRRITILEGLLVQLNPRVFPDVFIHILRELAEVYEKVYSLKIAKTRDKGESLRPKEVKLVKILNEAVGAHKRNLKIFDFELGNTSKPFPPDYEKTLIGSILSIGRLLGSISHEHPFHPQAIDFTQEGKRFYQHFLEYLELRPKLLEELRPLYDGSRDIPFLLDSQIEKIKERLRGLSLS